MMLHYCIHHRSYVPFAPAYSMQQITPVFRYIYGVLMLAFCTNLIGMQMPENALKDGRFVYEMFKLAKYNMQNNHLDLFNDNITRHPSVVTFFDGKPDRADVDRNKSDWHFYPVVSDLISEICAHYASDASKARPFLDVIYEKNPDVFTRHGVLHRVILQQPADTSIIQMLIDNYGAHVNEIYKKSTPLGVCLSYPHFFSLYSSHGLVNSCVYKIASLLIDRGTNMHEVCFKGQSLVHPYTCLHADFIALIAQKRPDLIPKGASNGWWCNAI